MKRIIYSREFKHQAVNLVVDANFTVKQVAKELGIHKNSLYRWMSKIEKYGNKSFPGRGSRDYIEQCRITQLEKENKRLHEELDLLKKYRIFIKLLNTIYV